MAQPDIDSRSLGQTLPAIHFDSSQFVPGDRYAAWQSQMAGTFDAGQMEESARRDCAVRSSLHMVERMVYAQGSYSGQAWHRSAERVRSDQVDHYQLRVLTAGPPVQFEFDDRIVELRQGEVLVCDMAQPYRFAYGEVDMLSAYLPRDLVDSMLPDPLRVGGMRLQGPCGSLLHSHLCELRLQLDHLTKAEAPAVMLATLHLFVASLAGAAPLDEQGKQAADHALRRQVCKYIDGHLADPGLNVVKLCSAFRISRATLYRLLEPYGGVAGHLQERKLARIHELLSQPGPRVNLSKLADEFGIPNASHFSRIYRQRFGYAPSETPITTPPASTAFPGWLGAATYQDWMYLIRN